MNLERFEIITEDNSAVSVDDVRMWPPVVHLVILLANLLSWVIFIVNTIIMLTGLPKLYKLYTLLIGQP